MAKGPIALALALAEVLDGLDIPWVLGGSVASSLVGEPRATMDLDVAVELSVQKVAPLVAGLEGAWYVSEEAAGEAVRHHSSFNAIYLEAMQKVDLFVLGDGLLDRRQMAGRRRVVVEEAAAPIWVSAAEDQILRKLEWYRLGDEISQRQWADVVAILRVQADRIDDDDLTLTAEQLGLDDLLRRARHDAQL